MIWNTALNILNHLLCVCFLPKMHWVTRLWPLIMFKNSIPLSLNLVSQNICGVKIALALHNFLASRSHGTVTLKLGLNCILRTFVHGSPLDKGRNNQSVKSVLATTAAPARQQRICSGGGPFSSTTFRIKQFATTAATVQYKDLQWRGTFVINYFPDKAFCHNCGSRPTTKDWQWGGDLFHRLLSG